jgi:hypothetical protein
LSLYGWSIALAPTYLVEVRVSGSIVGSKPEAPGGERDYPGTFAHSASRSWTRSSSSGASATAAEKPDTLLVARIEED